MSDSYDDYEIPRLRDSTYCKEHKGLWRHRCACNTRSRDKEKAKEYALNWDGELGYGLQDSYLAGLREARTESQDEISQLRQLCEADNVALKKAQAEIAKLRELLERADDWICGIRSETEIERSYFDQSSIWLSDYSALTEGDK